MATGHLWSQVGTGLLDMSIVEGVLSVGVALSVDVAWPTGLRPPISGVRQGGLMTGLPDLLLAILPFTIEQILAYWWVFPVSIVFATIALASGVSGALFFSPFFMLAVHLPPAQAVGAGLMTEVAGMGNIVIIVDLFRIDRTTACDRTGESLQ